MVQPSVAIPKCNSGFDTLDDVRRKPMLWRYHYHHVNPPSPLENLSPAYSYVNKALTPLPMTRLTLLSASAPTRLVAARRSAYGVSQSRTVFL